MNRRAAGVAILIGVLTAWAAPARAASESWVVEGELERFQAFTPPGQDASTHWSFRVVASDQRWSVRTTQTTGEKAGEHAFSYHEPGTFLSLMTGKPEQTELQRSVSRESEQLMWSRGMTNFRVIRTNAATDSMAVITSRTVPLFSPDGVATLWLAFCSAEHLNGQSSKRIQPMFDTLGGFDRNSYPVVGYMTYTDRSKRFPASVVFWNEGLDDDLEGEIEGPVPRLRRVVGPYAAGFTNSIFLVRQLTNVAGWQVPLRFSHTRLGRVPDATDARNLREVWRFDGQVTSVVRMEEPASMRPDFELKATYVLDQRIRKEHPGISEARYVATNSAWLDTDRLQQLPEISKRVAAAGGHRRWSPVGWLLVVVALLGFPAWALWSRNARAGRASQ